METIEFYYHFIRIMFFHCMVEGHVFYKEYVNDELTGIGCWECDDIFQVKGE